MSAPNTIAVIAFDGISPFHLSVPCMVFGEERTDAGAPRFRVRVCSAERGPLRTSAGFSIQVSDTLRALRQAQVVIVPSWCDAVQAASPAVLQALRAAHQRGATIVGLCLGAFVLAEAGLLDGRPATTHWHLIDAFRARFPAVALKPEVLYVDDGDMVTSAGTAAGIDCCLHLVRRWCGAEVANRAARRMVVAPHRQGGQAQYIARPVAAPTPRRDALAPVLEWMAAHLDGDHALDALAQRALMSRRTFTRRFRDATGTTVGQWMQHQRLALAQRLLEAGDRSIEAVAMDAGFGSAVSLRQHFQAVLRTSPSAYRRQFSMGRATPPPSGPARS